MDSRGSLVPFVIERLDGGEHALDPLPHTEKFTCRAIKAALRLIDQSGIKRAEGFSGMCDRLQRALQHQPLQHSSRRADDRHKPGRASMLG